MSDSTIVYQNRTSLYGYPPIFSTNEDAIAWSLGQGAFTTQAAAQQAFDELCTTYPAIYLWPTWIREVGRKVKKKSGNW